MPFLRRYDDPELRVVGEVLDFVLQMLKGLDVLHRNRIAHRDIASPNIMMDARSMYPDGHHPVRIYRALDVAHHANVLPRIDHTITSTSACPYTSHQERFPGLLGRSPMTWRSRRYLTMPYDAYKADILALGNMFDKEFLQRFDNVQVLQHLVACMKRKEPGLRPAADELLKMFQQLHALVPGSSVCRHLVQRSEQPYERFINTSVAIARDSLSSLKRIVCSGRRHISSIPPGHARRSGKCIGLDDVQPLE
ncbi:uncharacterized protein TRAVEDRAFT_51838 [Trametes versicolor FP-101664 SS1]|uniref:uncharacterized protein n=1 Tax=Trametes versicolor (strain FP-101664) TaxID=717944 RepID=UPI0004622343|nr:uncharacterized protein TRAVEDRAFT_51838 [Trametes versicolor FP-101664 SS1]EIW54113.1 hypothetical protein TRAVEDRAFT_51838 [Trametes versicolor FP-101664 SS1]